MAASLSLLWVRRLSAVGPHPIDSVRRHKKGEKSEHKDKDKDHGDVAITVIHPLY